MDQLPQYFRYAVAATLGALSLATAAWAAEVPMMISNGDMEIDADADQWPDGWGRAKTGGSWEAEDGKHFLRLTAAEPNQMTMFYRELAIPAGTKALELKYRVRVSGLQVGTSPWFDARFMMEFGDADRKTVKPGPEAPYLRKNTDGWEEKSVRFLVPDGARTLRFMPSLFKVGSGTLDIDEISLVSIEPAELVAEAAAKAEAAQAKLEKNIASKQAKAAANVQPDGSLISNGNFEASKSGEWPDNWGRAKLGSSWETEEGNRFMRLRSTAPGEMVLLLREVEMPEGIAAVEVRWRWRVTNLKRGKLPWNDARFLLKWMDGRGKEIAGGSGIVASYVQSDTQGWTDRTTQVLAPEGAVSLVLLPAVFQAASGTIDLDDISVKPTDHTQLIAAKIATEEAARKAYVEPEAPVRENWPKELHVEGRSVLDSDGREVLLQGVNAGGLETLVRDKQILKSALVAVDEWKANIVRLPVKEEFWFGRSAMQTDGGKSYRETVDNVVNLVANRGAYVLLDLHRFRAPKQEHADFWKDAAEHYKNHPAVLFDLFNEPHGVSWDVWKYGGFVSEKKEEVDESAFLTDEEKKKNQGFQSVGMQALADAVRSTGAKNIMIVGGLAWSGDLSGIAEGYALDDRSGNGIIYGWHQYNWHTDWKKTVLPTAAQYPILVGEFGADITKMTFIPLDAQEDPDTWVPDMLGFLQKNKFHWTAWCLHPKATPVLISDWNYTPTPFWGAYAKRALAGEKFEMKRMR